MSQAWHHWQSVDLREVYHAAIEAYRHGINVLPIPGDGSKRPTIKWQMYQHKRVTSGDLERWFLFSQRYPGLAFVTGVVSGGLELLDFDDQEMYRAWCAHMQARGLVGLCERVTRGYLEASPCGLHLLYRCRVIEGNQKLASRIIGPNQRKTVIETRGEGGLVVVAPSGSGVHPSGKPYVLLQGGPATIEVITVPERESLLAAARVLNEQPLQEIRQTTSREPSAPYPQHRNAFRPGDYYNREASWEEVLLPHGWELVRYVGDKGEWRRPGKQGPGISATTNWDGSDLLYVFSTSTIFEPERGYSKFSAYTWLNFGGDFRGAARDLVTHSPSMRNAANLS